MSSRLAALAFLLAAPVALAQNSSTTSFTPFVGAVVPSGATANRLSVGYTVGGAWDFRAPRARTLGARIEGSYSSLSAKGQPSGVSLKSADLGVNANVVLWAPMMAPGTILPYVTGGGTYARLEDRVQSGTISYSGPKNRLGFNVGAGTYVVVRNFTLRLDVRFKRVEGDGVTYQVIPITIGIRL